MRCRSRFSWLLIQGGLVFSLLACSGGGTDTGEGEGEEETETPSTGGDTGTGTGSDAGTGTGSDAGTGSGTGSDAGTGTGSDAGTGTTTEPFSFFVTSLKALQELSGNANGFGGKLSYGETGLGAGLRGADKICAAIAERSMPGAGQKPWRAFLSATQGEDGKQVNAIDRIGNGPWYDRLGRVLANTKADLLHDRPTGGNSAIANDFPNEDGVPNHRPDPSQASVDNHDTLTGSNASGTLYSATGTCKDWTANSGASSEGKPRVGHSWPRSTGGGGGGGGGSSSMNNWMSSLDESGCAPGVNLIETGPPSSSSNTVGSGGGYGGFYCFSLTP